MAISTAIDSNYLSKYFLEQLTLLEPSFDQAAFLDQFNVLPDIDKVDLIYDYMTNHNIFPVLKIPDSKNDFLAKQYRERGNKYFEEAKYLEALQEYNKSICFAKKEENLASIYGNRSAVFYRLNMPRQCMQDIYRALFNTCSSQLTAKLEARLSKANQMKAVTDKYHGSIPEIPSTEKNAKIQYASKCVKIEDDPGGVRVVATRDIEIGEIIAIEEPYACVPFREDRIDHCHHCLKLCYNMKPCEQCTQVLFCSDVCKKTAYTNYHKHECSILKTINELTQENTMLTIALRAAFRQTQGHLQPRGNANGDNLRKFDRTNDTHFSSLDLLHQAVLTATVFNLLKSTDYFNEGRFERQDKDLFLNTLRKKVFKKILYQQLLVTRANASKIYEYVNTSTVQETHNFGFGLYPFFSLFRHSCSAHIMKVYYGTTMVLRTINTIKRGQQCFVNRYGLRYGVYAQPVRDVMLIISRLPKCECIACLEDWKPNSGDLNEICQGLGIPVTTFEDTVSRVIGTNSDAALKYLPQLVGMLKQCESNEPQGNALTLKRLIAHCYVIYANKRVM